MTVNSLTEPSRTEARRTIDIGSRNRTDWLPVRHGTSGQNGGKTEHKFVPHFPALRLKVLIEVAFAQLVLYGCKRALSTTIHWFSTLLQELGMLNCHSLNENDIHAHLTLLFVVDSLLR